MDGEDSNVCFGWRMYSNMAISTLVFYRNLCLVFHSILAVACVHNSFKIKPIAIFLYTVSIYIRIDSQIMIMFIKS